MNANFPPDIALNPSRNTLNGEVDAPLFGDEAQRVAIINYGIAGRVWEAAYAMILYISRPLHLEFDEPFVFPESKEALTILELGSGTGIVASTLFAALATTGRHILYATDLPEVCPLLEENLRSQMACGSSQLAVRPLRWGSSEHAAAIAAELDSKHLTYIICSDLVYFPDLLGPLLRSLIQLSSPPFVDASKSTLTIIVSYKIRSLTKETPFWSAFGLWFDYRPVLVRPRDHATTTWRRFGTSIDESMYVFIARRRPNSFTWSVPTSDEELLDGVGAAGTSTRKAADTFEILLLMTMNDDESEA